MEVTFTKNSIQCLRPLLGRIHRGEQTQEVRLPDSCPDIGRILGVWGQTVIRGKEWHSISAGANGGVMAWVLYAPEDGTPPQVVEAWIPMQARWDLPETAEDGVLHLCPTLAGLDARCISARKIMIRAAVDTFAQGLSRCALTTFAPEQLPEDVQLRKQCYPAELPMEAGEKQLQLEERLSLPGNMPPIHKLVHYTCRPAVTEQKVLGNRLVFRGQAEIDLMYLTEDGILQSWQTECPFSQYTELDRDYSPSAFAWVEPLLTALEMEWAEDHLLLRGGVAAQFTVFDNAVIEVVEDAFSPLRRVELHTEQLEIPMLLDRITLQIPADAKLDRDAQHIASATPMLRYPEICTDAEAQYLRADGNFQTLSQDREGIWSGDNIGFQECIPFVSAEENQHFLWLGCPEAADIQPSGAGFSLKSSFPAALQVYAGEPVEMAYALDLGELQKADPDRPAIILRRVGEDGLWGLAKQCGSTVSAIREANQLSGEAELGQMLLIPIA